MSSATQQSATLPSCPSYSAAILSSATEVNQLADLAYPLLKQHDSAFQPDFFLATLTASIWAPRVVVIRKSGAIVGLVYAKERLLAGFATGIIYADLTLGGMVFSDSVDRHSAFIAAIEALAEKRGVWGLRILVPPGGFELAALYSMSSSAHDVSQTPVDYHSVLHLPRSYDLFLEGLGRQTRRNFRYYRRLEGATRTFVEELPFSHFDAGALSLLQEDVVGADSEGLARAMKMFSKAERPLLAGLRNRNGEWISIIGGWYESDRVVIFCQMNSDKKYPRSSLSVVMRGHLIEMLIGKGVRDIVFWAGVGGPLSRYVEPLATVAVYLDKRTLVWRALRRLLRSQRARIPGRVAFLAEWVVPATPATELVRE